jgi:uncharacterized membrane protein
MKNSNTSTDRKEEFKKALKKTAPYLLSHHSEENRDRCYKVSIIGREIHLCSRCTGIYIGILLAFSSFTVLNGFSVSTVFLLAFPTILEKYMTDILGYNSRNFLRTLNGILIGFAYVWGVKLFAQNPFDPAIIFTGTFFLVSGLFFLNNSN